MKEREHSRPGLDDFRIAVLDDEPFICDIVARALRANHQVQSFHDVESLYEAMEAGARFDLLFCDLMLQGANGRDVFETIQERWSEKAPTIIFLSGVSQERAREGILKGLDNKMIEKPFNLSDLRDAVSEVIASS